MRTVLILFSALFVAGCGGAEDPVRPDPTLPSRVVNGVGFSAQTLFLESFPVQLAPSITLHNESDEPAEVVFPDGCVVLLRVYRTPARTGEPAWDQARTTGCTAALVEVELAPGESRDLQGAIVPAQTILGDSLPNGRYYLAVLVRPGGGEYVLAAGEGDLAQ